MDLTIPKTPFDVALDAVRDRLVPQAEDFIRTILGNSVKGLDYAATKALVDATLATPGAASLLRPSPPPPTPGSVEAVAQAYQAQQQAMGAFGIRPISSGPVMQAPPWTPPQEIRSIPEIMAEEAQRMAAQKAGTFGLRPIS